MKKPKKIRIEISIKNFSEATRQEQNRALNWIHAVAEHLFVVRSAVSKDFTAKY